LRLAEPLAALSLASDLARGHSQDEALRATTVAVTVARAMQLTAAQLDTVYYGTLLRDVGCTATSQQYVDTYNASDITVRQRGDYIDVASTREAMRFLMSLGDEVSGPQRVTHFLGVLRRARTAYPEAARADCEVGAALVRQFGLSVAVADAVMHAFERWDGKGAPNGIRGDAIPIAARIASAAYTAVMVAELDLTLARETLATRSGTSLDPEVVACLLGEFDVVGSVLGGDAWVEALAVEPEPVRRVHDDELTPIARGYGHVADLKSPFLQGHSDGVAQVVGAAAALAGFSAPDALTLTRAGYLHDIGRVGIDTRIWSKPAALTLTEWEQVRLHTSHTERILRRAPCLQPLAVIAAAHHERPDGSGYHRAIKAPELSRGAQLLIAADVFHASMEDRPHRPQRTIAEAASTVRGLGIDAAAVRVVLEVHGKTPPRREEHAAGLSDREVEVLRLLARGLTKREVGSSLHVSPATVHTHTMHIYDKIGARSRAALALFGMEHGLLSSNRIDTMTPRGRAQ
jgi:HD-GYP domain-containing protein (c-di-GMP phosphodiesterase class II)